MRIFLLTAALCCVTVHSRREVLLDLSKMVVNDDEGLGWTTLSLVDPDDEGWAYETYPVKDVNAHALSACNVMLDRVDSWVLTPRVHWGEARRMHIEVQFSIRDCKDFPGSTKTCKETFGLYVRQTHPGQPNATRDNFREEEWDPLSRLTPQTPSPGPKMPAEGTEVRSVDVQPGATGVEFAFRDQGACISLLQIKIYYEVCGASVVSLASFPQTVAAGEYTKREGVCVRDALAKGKPMAACRSDGRWDVVYDACQCNKGFSPDSTMHQCVGCAPGHFKSTEGNGACSACPMNSQSTNNGATECTCLAGYYRAAGEAVTKACTQPPSKPSNVRVRNVQQSSAVVEWDEPSSLGGRSEMWYEWQCPRCESRVKATPADRRLSGRLVRLDGLEPDHVYTVMLTAHNHVSERVGDAAEYGLIEFRTAPLTAHQVGPVQVHAVHKDAVTVAWQPPARARGRTVEYEVEVRANGGRAMLRATEQTQHTEMGIQQGAVYEFRVRANVEGWGEWSAPLQYRAGGAAEAAVSRPSWQSSAVGDLPAWVLAVATLLLILLLAFAAMICRRSTRNRKQMSDLDVLDTYKQDTMTPDYNSAHRQFVGPIGGAMSNATKLSAPLIPAYGSPQAAYTQHRFKPYVDPTAYEDPNQALSEFTYDLDPAAVYITSVIGGGEFGDVCLGGLHRSSGGQMEPPETVAIKTLKPGSGAKARADFLLEASIMGQFAHPNVIRLIGVVTRNEPVMIVTEYMANGSLDNYLRSKDARGEEMGVARQLDMLRGVAAGMKYLTDKGFVHRDLAARNVLVDCELNCKIADFGLSRGVDNTAEQEYTTNGGKIPVRWTAPEAITHRKFTASSDVWSYGVLMWEVCSCGERPYWDWTNQTVIAEIMKGYRLPAPMDTPVALHRLMLWCWRLERHERPSFGQLLAIVEKYCRQPELVHVDTGSNPRSAHSSTSVSLGNGTPPPPVGCPPVAPPLDEFLRQLGLSHCWDRLHREGIDTVQRLARLSHLDALAVGLISDEWQRVRDGIAQLAARHRRRDDGFFV